jgi:hypothetical protein
MTAPADLEARLRALAEKATTQSRLDALITGNGVLSLAELLRAAAALGAAEAYEEAARTCERTASALTDGRRIAAMCCAEDIRALATAKRTGGG